MDNTYLEELKILRTIVPVGIRQGIILLDQTKGNIDAAAQQFREHALTLIASKTDTDPDKLLVVLEKNNYDIAASLKQLEEEKFTPLERVLRRYQDNKEDGLYKVSILVQEKYGLSQEALRHWHTLPTLPAPVFTFLVVTEWLNFEDYEGLSIALSFQLETVTQEMEKLGFNELATVLNKANQLRLSIFNPQHSEKDIHDYVAASNEFSNNKDYISYYDFFTSQRPLLIEKIYQLVTDHLADFS